MSRILANASSSDRPATDFYETPEEVTQALVDYLLIEKAARIWEPACGNNRIVRVLQRNGYEVVGTDIQTGNDFLQETTNRDCDWVITNPPFHYAEAFVRHAATLQLDGFAFLLKSQYWHSMKRNRLFFDIRPTFVLPLSWRPDFLFGTKSGSPTMEVLWTVWIDRHDEPTVYEPLLRPESRSKMDQRL
jgi:hypothetical protein